MSKKKVAIKSIVSLALVGIYSFVRYKMLVPVTNDVAMLQMQATDESYTIPTIYTTVLNWIPYVIAVVILIIFNKEIRTLIKKIKESINEEN